MSFLELLLLLSEIKAPLVVYRAFVEVEKVLAEVSFEDPLKGLKSLFKLTCRLSLNLLHRATVNTTLTKWSELIVLLVGIRLELFLDNPLFAVGFDSLHVGHIQKWRNGLAFFECLRVHIICHLNLQLSLPFNFELCLVLKSNKVTFNGIKEG